MNMQTFVKADEPKLKDLGGGTYLSSFLEAETDGTLRGGQLQPVIDYAAAPSGRFTG